MQKFKKIAVYLTDYDQAILDKLQEILGTGHTETVRRALFLALRELERELDERNQEPDKNKEKKG